MKGRATEMNINGKTSVCGLIGNPVEHTLSPLIHNTLAEKLSHNLVYVPFLVEGAGAEVEKAVKGAYELHIAGLNVTVPHKENVIPCLKAIDPLAEKIGAVNTLVRMEGGYKGYNTDMTGLYRAMKSEGIGIEGEKILLLGAGGAARAVAFLCVSFGAKQVYLLNRTFEKAERIAKEVSAKTGRDGITPMRLSDYRMLPQEKFLAIQCTSVGLYPDTEAAVITEPDFYERIHTGYDLIYRPADTKFMRLVKEAGGRAFHGLKMLLYQGIIAYELWNRVEVSEETAAEVYKKMKEEMGIEA